MNFEFFSSWIYIVLQLDLSFFGNILEFLFSILQGDLKIVNKSVQLTQSLLLPKMQFYHHVV